MNMQDYCKDLLNRDDWVILDTETTGLDEYAESCQIGILSPSGKVLLDTLVKPVRPIPSDAIRIHGITDKHVENAPTFHSLIPELSKLLTNKFIVVYNADYDRRILGQSSAIKNKLNATSEREARAWMSKFVFVDVMGPYAEYWGDWSEYHQSYTWQKLTYACQQQGVPVTNEHSAIGDCKLTLALIRKIGGFVECPF